MCSCIHEVLPKPRTPIQSPGLLQSFHFMDGITTNTFRYFEILVIIVQLTSHPPLNMQKKKCNGSLKLNRHLLSPAFSYFISQDWCNEIQNKLHTKHSNLFFQWTPKKKLNIFTFLFPDWWVLLRKYIFFLESIISFIFIISDLWHLLHYAIPERTGDVPYRQYDVPWIYLQAFLCCHEHIKPWNRTEGFRAQMEPSQWPRAKAWPRCLWPVYMIIYISLKKPKDTLVNLHQLLMHILDG